MSERYSRRNAARELDMSLSSFDILRRRVRFHEIRQGNKVFFLRSQIESVARQPLPGLWPPKQNGKTTRHFGPVKVELNPTKDKKGAA